MNRDNEVLDTFWVGWWVIAMAIIFLIAGVIYATGWYAVLPWFRNQEYVITRNSNEYVVTKQTQLLKWLTDAEQLDAEVAALKADPQNSAVVDAKARQLVALVNRMRVEAELIRPEQVPATVRAYLR